MEPVGSISTLIAASLATAGQFLQSQILDMFEQGLGGSLAYGIWIGAAVAAVFAFMMTGRARLILVFILGPVMFHAATRPRVETLGTTWQFGPRTYDQQEVLQSLQGVYSTSFFGAQPTGLPRVSWFFAKFDEVTSGMIQTTISAISSVNLNADVEFLARTQRFQQVFAVGIPDPTLQIFVHTLFIDRCAEYIALSNASVDPEQVTKRVDITARLNTLTNRPVLSDSDPMFPFFDKMRLDGYFGFPAPEPQPFYTCPALWNLSVTAIRFFAHSQAVTVANARRPNELPIDESMFDLARKFGTDESSDPADIGPMVNNLTVHMLWEAMKERYSALSILNLSDPSYRPTYQSAQEDKKRYDALQELRQTYAEDVETGTGEYYAFVTGMPYVQGIALFFLSVVYPIAALTLLIPGRQRAFLLWFALWAWIKLWDVGFAIAMLLDQLLYFLLPHAPLANDADLATPGQALQVVLSVDPTHSLGTYYNLMAMVLTAIPLMSGMLVWRGVTEVMREVTGRFQQFTTETGQLFSMASKSAKAEASSKAASSNQSLQSQQLTQQLANNGASATATSTANTPAQSAYAPSLTAVDQRGAQPSILSIGNTQTPQRVQVPQTPARLSLGTGLSDPSLRSSVALENNGDEENETPATQQSGTNQRQEA